MNEQNESKGIYSEGLVRKGLKEDELGVIYLAFSPGSWGVGGGFGAEGVQRVVTLPYLTLPYLNFPFLTLPYLTLHYLYLYIYLYLTLTFTFTFTFTFTLTYLTGPYLTLPYSNLTLTLP